MPIDEWRKGRDRDHAKRAKRELAAGMRPSYERPWETEHDGTQPLAGSPLPDNRPFALPSMVHAWLEQLRGRNEDAQRAMQRLEELGPESAAAVPVLVDALRHSVPIIRRESSNALARIGLPAVPALCRLLHNENQTEAERTAECLAAIGHSASSAVIRLMNSQNQRTREYATRAAGLGAVSHKLLWSMAVSKDERQQRVARDAFVVSGSSAVSFLLDRLNEENLERGLIAISILGELGENAAEALPALTEILKYADDTCVTFTVSNASKAIRQAKRRAKTTRKLTASPLKRAKGQKDPRAAAPNSGPDHSKPKRPQKAK